METDRKLRVLCIDAELALRRLLEMGFKNFGFYVETVGSAEEALDVLAGGSSDAMVSDISLPVL